MAKLNDSERLKFIIEGEGRYVVRKTLANGYVVFDTEWGLDILTKGHESYQEAIDEAIKSITKIEGIS